MRVERWWDPAGPVVDLLTPGSDRQLDTANALVAVHRAGAAALIDAGSQPLCDVQRINHALECAQQAYAGPVTKALSHALGDDTYARLLVNDIAKEAHATTIRLYQTAVAKGVAPSVAAARAAAVYAVPARALGKYALTAIDPAAKDATITDASDSALFTWVSQAATRELEGVSKAETLEVRRAAQVDEPRDHGRYAAARTDEEQAALDWFEAQFMEPQVATEPAKPKKQPRRLRQLRKVRAIPVVKPAERTTAQRASATRTPAFRALAQRARAKLRELNAIEAEKQAPQVTDSRLELGDMTHLAGPVHDPKLTNDVTYAMTIGQWHDLHLASVNDAARKYRLNRGRGMFHDETLMSARALMRGADNNAGLTDQVSHDEALRNVRDQLLHRLKADGSPEYSLQDPVVLELDDTDAEALMHAAMEEHRWIYHEAQDDIKRKMLRKYAREASMHDLDINAEIQHVQIMPDYHDPDQYLFVWQPPDPNLPTDAPRNTPAVVEVTVSSAEGNLHGEYDPGTRNAQPSVRLDPNQLLQINGSDPYDIGRKQSFDQMLGMRRWQLAAYVVDPTDVGKATETLERRQQVASMERRDAGGRFAAVDVDLSDHSIQAWLEGAQDKARSKARSKPRQLRKVRAIRAVSAPVAAPTDASRATAQRATAERQGAERATYTRAQVSAATRALEVNAASHDPDALPLADGEVYTVMGGNLTRNGRPYDVRKLLGLSPNGWDRDLSAAESANMYLPDMQEATAVDAQLKAGGASRSAAISGPRIFAKEYAGGELGMEQFIADYENKAGHLHKGGPFGATEVRLHRVRKGGEVRVKADVRDLTDYDAESVHVFRWDENATGDYLSVNFDGSYRLLSRAATHDRLRGLWSELRHGEIGGDIVGYVENPKVDLWNVTDTPRPNGPLSR